MKGNLARGLSPFLRGLSYVIWGLFVLHFVVEFVIAPRKLIYPAESSACSWRCMALRCSDTSPPLLRASS